MSRRKLSLRDRIGLVVLAGGSAATGLLVARTVSLWHREPIAAARHACLVIAIALGTASSWLLLQRGPALARHLLAHPRRLRAVLVAVATLAALLLGEGALHLGEVSARRVDVDVRGDPFVTADPQLGYRLQRAHDIPIELVRRRDDAVIARVHYGLDADGRRRTVLPRAAGHDRAVLFFGCSQTFGHGLDDADTVPSRYAAAMPRDLVVNLAVPGYGPHHALVLAREPATLALPALPRAPVAVFPWIDHHLQRLCGSLRVRNLYGIDAPCFVLGADGHPQLLGPFRTAQPLRTAWLWAVSKIELLQLLGYDWPGGVREADLDLAAAIFDDLAAALRTARCRLLLVQNPGNRLLTTIEARLRDRDIRVCDLGTAFDPHADDMALDRDGHPTATAARRLGEQIALAVQRDFP